MLMKDKPIGTNSAKPTRFSWWRFFISVAWRSWPPCRSSTCVSPPSSASTLSEAPELWDPHKSSMRRGQPPRIAWLATWRPPMSRPWFSSDRFGVETFCNTTRVMCEKFLAPGGYQFRIW
jgi:hypothetical protein